jgi:hypothetical protein
MVFETWTTRRRATPPVSGGSRGRQGGWQFFEARGEHADDAVGQAWFGRQERAEIVLGDAQDGEIGGGHTVRGARFAREQGHFAKDGRSGAPGQDAEAGQHDLDLARDHDIDGIARIALGEGVQPGGVALGVGVTWGRPRLWRPAARPAAGSRGTP